MQAVILAAGKGSRMGDITKNIAKPMVAVEGISLLERNIVSLYSVGVRKAIVAIGHRGDDIRNLLGNFFQEMEIVYFCRTGVFIQRY